MQNDLNTIYFETAFLQKSNEKMKSEIEILFNDYTKIINYFTTLEQCRTNDDWENVLTICLKWKRQRYNNFIDQGEKFYEKFKVILNGYENEK